MTLKAPADKRQEPFLFIIMYDAVISDYQNADYLKTKQHEENVLFNQAFGAMRPSA